MTPAEMVARLELERLSGMPRWQVEPLPRTMPATDTLAEIAERRRVLKEDYLDIGRDWMDEANAQIMRGREAS